VNTQEAAIGQAASIPNQRVIEIKPIVCDCVGASHEKVTLRGNFQISFTAGEFLGVRGIVPVLPVKLSNGFKGACPSTEECLVGIGTKTGRHYMAKKRLALLISSSQDQNKPKLESGNGMGTGRFLFGVVITAHPNPPPNAEANGRVVKWTLIYKIDYEWDPDKKLKSFKVTSWDVRASITNRELRWLPIYSGFVPRRRTVSGRNQNAVVISKPTINAAIVFTRGI
jgi:hypothetical protein